MQKQVFEAHALWDNREYVSPALDEATHYFGQAIFIGHAQAQAQLVPFVRDNCNTVDGTEPGQGRGIQIGGMNLDFGSLRLPVAHLVHAHDLAFANERNPVAALLHFALKMGVEEDRRSAVALLANHVADQLSHAGIESGGWLIEGQNFGFVDDGLRQAHALHHSL